MRKASCVFAAVLAVAGYVGAQTMLPPAEGRWTVPANQWEHVYAASNGRPEVTDARWLRNSYQSADPNNANCVAIVNDSMEGDVLWLCHTNSATAANRWPNYTMTAAPGSGTTNDLITIDLRFRLADDSQADATSQLALSLNRPRLDGTSGRNTWYLEFAKSGIKRNGSTLVSGTALGTGWHTVRMLIDVAANSAKVYLDNVAAPVITGWPSSFDTVSYNQTMFGDGASALIGMAEVKYLRWTGSELVEPLTLFHIGNADPVSEGWTYEHNAKELVYTASNGVLPEASSPTWTRGNFAAGDTAIVTDEITGEQALHLLMTNTVNPWTYGFYRQTGAEGTFTTNQLTTCSMRFRLVDATQADSQAQFHVGLNGPRPDGVSGRQMFYVTFAKDRIRYYNNGSLTDLMFEIGTNWHELVWVQNWRTREASFYLDGIETAAFSHQSYQAADVVYNHTSFGDGSSGIQGIARVSSFHLTRQGKGMAWSGGSEDGTKYWEGIVFGTSLGEYSKPVPADVIGHAEGWTASALVRVVDASTPLDAVGMQVYDGTDRWSMMFTPTECYYYNQASAAVSLGRYIRREYYHLVQMHYDPAGDNGNGVVRYYDDGWLKGTVTRADTLDLAVSPRMQWGSANTAATSVQRWAWVEVAPGNRVIAPKTLEGTLVTLRGGGAPAAVWRTEEFLVEMYPVIGSAESEATVSNGVLHVVDAGTQVGDLVALSQNWRACPETGATVEACVKVVSCEGPAGVMLLFSDGEHEEILTLYADKIELNHAGLSHVMDTTGDFHVYRVEIKGNDVSVAVDGVKVIDGAGTFTQPAHEGRNRVSYGAGSSASTGEAFWDWVRWTEMPVTLKPWEHPVNGATHHVIYKQPGLYACFPSLWAEPETWHLYTSFSIKSMATHFETADTRTGRMSSADGGVTWSEIEGIPNSAVSDMPGPTFTAADGALVRIGQYWRRWYPMERLDEFIGRYEITYSSPLIGSQSNTFSTLSGAYVERSENGGIIWERQEIPGLDTYVSGSSPWANTQLPNGTVLRAFMVKRDKDCSGKVCVAITRDGKSAEVVEVMGDPENQLAFTEETLMHTTPKGVVWMLARVQGTGAPIWQAVSQDGGRTWSARPTEIDARQTPPSGLVKLADGRLVLVYGYRDAPSGIRALVSEDEGLTWRTDHVLVLRDDGDGYDLGYPRAVKLPDGTVAAVYYYATDDKVRHIACTRFKVPKLPARRGR